MPASSVARVGVAPTELATSGAIGQRVSAAAPNGLRRKVLPKPRLDVALHDRYKGCHAERAAAHQ